MRVIGMTDREGAEPATDEIPVVRGLEPFESFYQRERRSMIALAFALSRSRVGAEDLAQDALMSAYRRWDEVGRLDRPEA